MAKALFHRNQKVWVELVGTWAVIEKVAPVWAKGFDEPVRITYDVGLGREFLGHELQAEDHGANEEPPDDGANWRILRARNKWQAPEDCGHHPYPGTFPVVVTDATDWGGWRTPGAEYDRDPRRMEYQARLIASAPKLLAIAHELAVLIGESPDEAPEPVQALAQRAAAVQRYLNEVPAAPERTGRGGSIAAE
ncbi:MAG TPA: hypothetical protein VHY32_11540 [Caulobacteraceae bacterium]|nr:hypothetical protein [Caulobacteraceae bacterium]